MIGHDDEFVEGTIGAEGFGAPPFLLGDHADRRQPHGIIDDLPEERPLSLGANRYEICTRSGVIPIPQSVGFGAVPAHETAFGFVGSV
jgi:hypothetical protein